MTKTNEEWVEEFQNKDHIITSDGGLYVAIDAHWLRTLLTEKDKEREEAYTKGRSDEAKTCKGCQGRCEKELQKALAENNRKWEEDPMTIEHYNNITKDAVNEARETWLREEIVKLNDEKFIWLTPEEMKEHDGCRYKRNGLFVGQVAGDNFNGAIQIIQHRYQSELDQPTV